MSLSDITDTAPENHDHQPMTPASMSESLPQNLIEAANAFGVNPGQATPLQGGMQNPIWKVHRGDELLVLRHSPPPKGIARRRTSEHVAWEHRFILHCKAEGLPVPAPMATSDGRTFLDDGAGGGWSLFPFLQSEHHHWDKQEPLSVAQCESAVDMLVRLHEAGRSFVCPGQRPAMGEILHLPDWIGHYFQGIEDLDEVLRQAALRGVGSAGRIALPRHLDHLQVILAEMRSAASDIARSDCEHIAIHGDFTPWNLGYRGDQVVAIYDFDDTAQDLRAVDVASAIRAWAHTGRDGFDRDTAMLMLRRYQRHLPLSHVELRHLPVFMAAKLMLYGLSGAAQQIAEPDQDHGWRLNLFIPGCMRHLAAREQWRQIIESV